MAIMDLLRQFGYGQFGNQQWPGGPLPEAPDLGEAYSAAIFPREQPASYPGNPGIDKAPEIPLELRSTLKMGNPDLYPDKPPTPAPVTLPAPPKKKGIFSRINQARFVGPQEEEVVEKRGPNDFSVIGKNPETGEEIRVPTADIMPKPRKLSMFGNIIQHLPRDLEAGLYAATVPGRRGGMGPNIMNAGMAGLQYSRQQDLLADHRKRQAALDARSEMLQNSQIVENLAQAAYAKKRAEMEAQPKLPTNIEQMLIEQWYSAKKTGNVDLMNDIGQRLTDLKESQRTQPRGSDWSLLANGLRIHNKTGEVTSFASLLPDKRNANEQSFGRQTLPHPTKPGFEQDVVYLKNDKGEIEAVPVKDTVRPIDKKKGHGDGEGGSSAKNPAGIMTSNQKGDQEKWKDEAIMKLDHEFLEKKRVANPETELPDLKAWYNRAHAMILKSYQQQVKVAAERDRQLAHEAQVAAWETVASGK